MPEMTWPDKSPRHGFDFDRVPTVRGSQYGGPVVVHYHESYGPILDSVFEMTCDVADANGEDPKSALQTVLRDEGWRVLPRHQKAILARVNAR